MIVFPFVWEQINKRNFLRLICSHEYQVKLFEFIIQNARFDFVKFYKKVCKILEQNCNHETSKKVILVQFNVSDRKPKR